MRATWASCGHAATARSAADRSPAQLASHVSAPLAGPMARPRSRLRLAILAEFVASHVGLRFAPAISAFGLNRVLAVRLRPRSRSPPVRSRRPHPRISAQVFVAAMPSPRPARSSRRVRRTASVRLSPLGAKPPRPLLTQRLFSRFATLRMEVRRREPRERRSGGQKRGEFSRGTADRATPTTARNGFGREQKRRVRLISGMVCRGRPRKTSERAAARNGACRTSRQLRGRLADYSRK